MSLSDLEVIENAMQNSLNYDQYIEHYKEQVELKPTNEEEEMILHYTKLNATRMDRLNRTTTIPEEIASKMKAISNQYKWVILTEAWCGDAAQCLPVLNKLQELNENIEMNLLLRDSNLEVMDRYLTNGGRSIPKMIVIDKTKNEIVGTWGPRPKGATKLLEDYRAKHGVIDDPIKKDLQVWYNKDKGIGVMEDVLELHTSF